MAAIEEPVQRMKIINRSTAGNLLKKIPAHVKCQFCKQAVTTETEQNPLKDDMID